MNSTEKYRPIYHFTPKKGFAGDPNGLFYYRGVYHLFYQYNYINYSRPVLGPVCWGHAVSSDLISWEEKEPAVMNTEDYSCLSGSGIVDRKNVSGLKQGDHDPILLFWTSNPGYSLGIKMSYSVDGGKTFKDYRDGKETKEVFSWRSGKNFKDYPTLIIDCGYDMKAADRDPKVFYYEPLDRYIMIIYAEHYAPSDQPGFAFFSSQNLLCWTYESFVPGLCECPDMFELETENTGERKWVLTSCCGNYYVGDFDGHRFTPCQELNTDQRNSADYASQTWNDGKRTVQISFVRSVYRNTDFNQHLTLPAELGLKKENGKYILTRKPVRELENYETEIMSFEETEGQGNLFDPIKSSEALDIRAEFYYDPFLFIGELGTPVGNVQYIGPTKTLETAFPNMHIRDLAPKDGTVSFRVLTDRQSMEIFADNIYMVFDRFAEKEELSMTFSGKFRVKNFSVREINKQKNDFSERKNRY